MHQTCWEMTAWMTDPIVSGETLSLCNSLGANEGVETLGCIALSTLLKRKSKA